MANLWKWLMIILLTVLAVPFLWLVFVSCMVALTGCIHPPPIDGGYGPPFGIAVSNESSTNLDSVSLTFQSGGRYDFGRIPWHGEVFRFIEIRNGKEAVLDLKWADGQVERKLYIFDRPTSGSIRIPLWPRRPDDTHKYSTYTMKDPWPGNPRGPQCFYIANDTPGPIRADVHLKGSWGATQLPGYSVASWGYWDGGLLGNQQATIRLAYAGGKEFKVTGSLQLKPGQRLVFIIKEEGEVVVWDDPTVDEASVVESVEITRPEDDASK